MKKGDKVMVLDDAISGVVSKIIGNRVIITTADGFDLEFLQNELVVVDGSVSSRDFARMNKDEVLAQKQSKMKRIQKQERTRIKSIPPMEVDLHIHQLVPKSGHLTNYEMLTLQLDVAKRQLEFAISKRIQRVVFIHGIGEGVLRTELEYLFGRYDNIEYYDADYQKYGRGATEVYIFQNVPKKSYSG